MILILMLFAFTFVTMVGGNPKHDAYGFRYWKHPGAFGEYLATGSLGQFEGFLGSLWAASFCIVGPEYISMVAAEAKRPRIYIKQAFKTVYWRFGLFFIGGALCTGIVIPYNDPTLVRVLGGGKGGGTAAASPYVIAMQNLAITGFPHLVNALLVTSIFSAGNAYTYCATRYVAESRVLICFLQLTSLQNHVRLGHRRACASSPQTLHQEWCSNLLFRHHDDLPLPELPFRLQQLSGSPELAYQPDHGRWCH